jgi:hypothetical protein
MGLRRLLLLIAGGFATGLTTAATAAPPSVDYNRDIRPLLSRYCFACHGSDEQHREAGLRLDRRESALKPLDSGFTAITPGQVDDSELYLRISSDEASERMPPAATGTRLTAAQIELLRRWIAEGAPYAEHWAFVPPQRPALPPVQDKTWPKNGIDYFIQAKLEQHGLSPRPEADRHALIRRASFDLRGLPPTPAEVDRFVHDSHPEAYARLLDRLLADPAYGERWARVWLDLARYADSAGYGSDPLRPIMFRYRDWVIDAFNSNLPFDEFTIAQLAGDLLPNPALEQRMATAFHRNTMTNTEGGTDDEEFRVAAVRDRVDTTIQVWMGLTMGCAKCHNHKYDPISQKDYYQFYAIFNQTADQDLASEAPTLPAPTPAMIAETQTLDAQIAALRQQLATPTEALAKAQLQWEAGLQTPARWTLLRPTALEADNGTELLSLPDGSILATGASKVNGDYTITARMPLPKVLAFRLEVLPDERLPRQGVGRAEDGNFVLSKFSVTAVEAGRRNLPVVGRFIRVQLPGPKRILSLAEVEVFSGDRNIARQGTARQSSTAFDGPADRAIDGNPDGDYNRKSTTHTGNETGPWWELDLGGDRTLDRIKLWNRTDHALYSRSANAHIQILDAARKPVWEQQLDQPAPHAELLPTRTRELDFARATADDSQTGFPVGNAVRQARLTDSGWSVGGQTDRPHTAVFILGKPVELTGDQQLAIRLQHRYRTAGKLLGRFRISMTSDPVLVERATLPSEVRAIIDRPAADRSPAEQTRLAEYYRGIAPSLQPLRNQIQKLEKSKPVFPMLPVMVELPEQDTRKSFIQIKGNFLSPGEEVSAALPAAFRLKSLAAETPTRLTVAHWLVHRDNPLTARVMVNRLWSRLFGRGLVETEEDFGMQGMYPSHPRLLDWLAVEFMQPESPTTKAWDIKATLRQMMLSSTYRQSAVVSPQAREADPQNRWLSRGPRFRLEAEMVRDQALALSGLLSRKMYGPSVFPPQPNGMWQAAFNGQRTWTTSPGADKYRRALYTFWRRTVPYPSMATFDAPSRETCAIRRIRTNTPLQAFVTLNDPVYVEAAQALARRIVREGGTTPTERIRFALELCLARPAADGQVATLLTLYDSEMAHYRQSPPEALSLATEPLGPLPAGMKPDELAAWTVISNVLLNLDAVLCKG